MTFLPIVERELRIAVRKPGTYWLRFFAALGAITIMLLALLGMGRYRSPVDMAKEIFGILSGLTMVFCIFSGMFQTADCLSSEKRDGTLGLLFLTDLHGYDVVLGKLAANSLHSCYGLMSVLPILAIPLLAGGVTGGEFWRMVLVLLTGLFFSLGVGMFVSAVTRETRQALSLTFFIILVLVALLPTVQALINLLLSSKHVIHWLLWPSLGYAFEKGGDSFYNARGGIREFWGSILTILGIGFGCLVLASLILPHAWQEKSQSSAGAGNGSKWNRLRFGAAARRQSIRRLLQANPFLWLAIRDRLSQLSFWFLAGVAVPLWLLLLYTISHTSGTGATQLISFQFMVFLTVIFSLIFKFIVASEASRRLSDDRQSGALELLLVTPLSEQEIVTGQRQALRNQFWLPIVIIEVLFAVVLGISCSTSGRLHDGGIFAAIMFGNMIVLLTDFNAMGWVGMWAGLRARQHHRAVLLTLLQILVVPWLLYFFLGVAGFFNTPNSPVPFFIIWYLLGVGNDLLWARVAREGLKSEFRLRAAGATLMKPRLPADIGVPS